MKPLPCRYPSTNHTITLTQNDNFHTFDITISYKLINGAMVPFNIIFNNTGADRSGLPILMDQLGTKLSQILEEMYK